MKSVNSHFTFLYISQHSSQSHLPTKFLLCTLVHIDSFMPFLKPHIMNCIYNNYALWVNIICSFKSTRLQTLSGGKFPGTEKLHLSVMKYENVILQ